MKLREGRLIKKTQVLSRVLRWEPVLGVGVLICIRLMNVFVGTLSPIAVAQQPTQTGDKLMSINHRYAQLKENLR